jgi:hypothetical protein
MEDAENIEPEDKNEAEDNWGVKKNTLKKII